MLNIKEEIQVLLLRKGLSMSKMTRNMKKEGGVKHKCSKPFKNVVDKDS